MRPYGSVLISLSVVAVIVFSACAAKNPGGSFVVANGSTDTATSNSTTQHSSYPYVPGADGPRSVANATVAGGNVSPHLMLAAAAAGLTGGSVLMGPGEATFGGIQLVKFSPDPQTTALSYNNSGVITAFSDGLLAWGRWAYNPAMATGVYQFFKSTTGETTTASPTVVNGGFHYIVGAPTPVANLPASGKVSYSLLGASQPTRASGTVPENNFTKFESGFLAVQWGGASTKVGVDFLVSSFDNGKAQTFHVITSGGAFQPQNSQLGLNPGQSTFSGSIPTTSNDSTTCFLNQCVTNISGFFAGPAAERAGLSYVINPGGNAIHGVAAFTTGSTTSPPAPLTQTNPVTVSIAGGPDISALSPANTGDVTQNADLSLSRINYSTGLFTVTPGTTVSADVGGDQFITWGRWVGGQAAGNVFGGPPGANPGNASLHYIAGIPTPSGALPASGTATFNLLGATSPTFGNGVGGPGTVTAATMAVAWGGAASTKVGLDMSVNMPGDQVYRILTTGGLATPGTSQIHSLGGPNFFGSVAMPATGRACTGGTCTTEVNGFFAGPAAERAALTYTISNGAMANGVFGAAAFKR